MSKQPSSITIDQDEIEKFTKMADEWWDENGKFKPLHKFNPVRIDYINRNIQKHFNRKIEDVTKPLSGFKILDIGCGGGLVSEPVAKLGANVTAIDAGEKNIKIASIHAKQSSVDINYRNISAEDLLKEGNKFDVILNLEVLEHVADVGSFIETSIKLLNPGGIMFMATLNRTAKSYAFAVIGAEYVLRWLPKGTHDWKKFLKPSEIAKNINNDSITIKEIKGISFNPIKDKWFLSDDTDINYMMTISKENKTSGK